MIRFVFSQPDLSVPGVMESGVRGEDQQPAGVAAPGDLLLTDDRLHDGVETALRSVQVTRHFGRLHLRLKNALSDRSLVVA